MRLGVVISLVGHVGTVVFLWLWQTAPWFVALIAMLTLGLCSRPATPPLPPSTVVPVEIVDIGAENNVRALAEQVPDEEVAPQEEEQQLEEPTPPPAPSPQQTRPQPRRDNDDFNLADISGMIDRQRNQGSRQQEGAAADRNQRGAGLGTAERATVESRVASLVDRHLRRCWRSTEDMPDPERLIVVVEFQIDRNGRLAGQPRVTSPTNYTFDPLMAEAVNRALRAVRVCDPYEFLPNDPAVGQYFDVWRTQEVTFGRQRQ